MKIGLFTKNFTLLIAGQASSLFGNCILDFALSMYVLEKTGSAAVFAGFLAAAMLPTILLSPLGGVLADRANRRNIMVILDLLAGIVVLIAALMIDRGNNLATIAVTLILQSILGAFETPTVQACVPQMHSGANIIRGNAVVNQIGAVSALAAPFIGSMLYTAFGLKPVMYAGGVCFLVTSLFECFIRLDHTPQLTREPAWGILRKDLAGSARFVCREQPAILKTLLMVTVIALFVQGSASVGLPFLIRTVLGLSARHYGAAESIFGFAAIAGSIVAGLIVTKFKTGHLNLPVLGMGLCLLLTGLLFFMPAGVPARYVVLVAAFALIQIAASIFSIFCLSVIQQATPVHMTGKVMAFAASFSVCAQPLGQMLFGLLFDGFSNAIEVVLMPAGIILCAIGLAAKRFFKRVELQLHNREQPLAEHPS